MIQLMNWCLRLKSSHFSVSLGYAKRLYKSGHQFSDKILIGMSSLGQKRGSCKLDSNLIIFILFLFVWKIKAALFKIFAIEFLTLARRTLEKDKRVVVWAVIMLLFSFLWLFSRFSIFCSFRFLCPKAAVTVRTQYSLKTSRAASTACLVRKIPWMYLILITSHEPRHSLLKT